MKNPGQDSIFQLPAPSQKRLSFADANKQAVVDWVEQLPVADLSASTRMLYNALKEINQLQATAAIRLELIEALKPALTLSLERLSRHFLNQPVLLPERPEKIANLHQVVLADLANAYLYTVEQSQQKMGALIKKPVAIFTAAIYQAMDTLLQQLVCNYQLYRADEAGFWLKIHRLHHMARTYKVLERPVFAEQAVTIEDKYRELLLWGAIKANQLRQDDIRRLIPLVTEWAKLIELIPLSDSGSAFIVEPTADQGPVFRRFFSGNVSANARSLETQPLIDTLKQLRDPLLQKPISLPENLINHLILAWGVVTDRTFMRLESNSQLTMCIGLSTTHYYVAEKTPFGQLVLGDIETVEEPVDGEKTLKIQPDHHVPEDTAAVDPRFQGRDMGSGENASGDVWNESLFGQMNDKKRAHEQKAQVEMESIVYHMRQGLTQSGIPADQYQQYDVNIINMSPGGYCLSWEETAPATIKAGEIIGIKTDLYKHWHIGAIRWVKQFENKSLRIGVELISPSAIAFGAKRVTASGKDDTSYLRVLYLPEVKANGQPSTLITPTLSFKEGQKLVLAKKGRETQVILDKLLSSSGSYSQFSFSQSKPLAQPEGSGNMAKASAAGDEKSDTGSVWELL